VLQQRQKRMLLMTGFPPERSGVLPAVANLLTLYLPLSGPGAMQRHHLILLVVHIQAGRQCLGQINFLT